MTTGTSLDQVSNIYRTLMKSPAAASGVRASQEIYEAEGLLDAAARETVALCVAARTSCAYCSAAHQPLAQAAGLSEDDIKAVLNSRTAPTARIRLVAAAARRLLDTAGAIGRDERADFRAKGLSDAELVEIVGLIGLYMTATFAANLFEPPLDPEIRRQRLNEEDSS